MSILWGQMTTSSWDKLEIQKQFGECQSLKDLISRLEDEFQGRGEVICEIRVNGMVVHEKDESTFAQSAMEEIESLSIASERPGDLILSTLGSALDYVPRLHKACESTAELMRGSDSRLAQMNFTELLDGCQWLVDTVVYLRSAADSVGNPIKDQLAWRTAEGRFAIIVGDILAAFQKKDFVLVADLVEYDLFNHLEEWSNVIRNEHGARAAK